MRRKSLSLLCLAIIIVVVPALSACSSKTGVSSGAAELSMAPMDGMPDSVQKAPATVQQAYRFAVANPDTLKQIPCYCGCGAMGHTSNYACYVKSQNADGSTQFDTHALGCTLCVDITQDTMRLLKEGKTAKDIRAYVDGKYSQYGPSNIP